MKEIAIKFLWKAPLERVFIAVLLIAIYFLSRRIDDQQEAMNRQNIAYNQQLIECAQKTDSLKTYYNGIVMDELKSKIAKYDTLIAELKNKAK